MKILTSFRTLVSGVLSKVIPSRTKRLILLSSLYARLRNTTSFDSATIHKLNKALSLCKDDKAIQFPMHLTRAIWRGDRGNVILYPEPNIAELEILVRRVMQTIPSWLRYDEVSMFKDLYKLFENRSMLAS